MTLHWLTFLLDGVDNKTHKTTGGMTSASDSMTTACVATGFALLFFFFFFYSSSPCICVSLRENPSDTFRLIRGGLALLVITRQCVLASPLHSSKCSICSGPSRSSVLSYRRFWALISIAAREERLFCLTSSNTVVATRGVVFFQSPPAVQTLHAKRGRSATTAN